MVNSTFENQWGMIAFENVQCVDKLPRGDLKVYFKGEQLQAFRLITVDQKRFLEEYTAYQNYMAEGD